MPNRWPRPIEIVAYLIAHVVGLVWGMLVSPFLAQLLMHANVHPGLMMTSIFMVHAVIVTLVVMVLFFALRAAMQPR